ncbi:putative transmembrane protein [Gregarina niphandrodes]|uniref:Transmembrane protein n=1 Tax=Gregarina niphandrodes TaxID=110365 RepID=A0A023BAS3_GRENI|nr:putative transmembrane protein [Gregarina niphandrodes]EZG78552.1 putative transmembrane protein [Gregarina niphandrodes]|eukprot:XP_011129258.1 putative transmembrane protein [Gregarina niphandrodes]
MLLLLLLLLPVMPLGGMVPAAAYIIMSDVFWSGGLRRFIVDAMTKQKCFETDELNTTVFRSEVQPFREFYSEYSRLLYSLSGISQLLGSRKRLQYLYTASLLELLDNCLVAANPDDLAYQSDFRKRILAKVGPLWTWVDDDQTLLSQDQSKTLPPMADPSPTAICIRSSICEAVLEHFCYRTPQLCETSVEMP